MNRAWLPLFLIVLSAACIGPEPSSPPSSASSSSDSDPIAGNALVRAGIVGPATTRAEHLVVYANVTGTASLRLQANGTLVFQGTVRDDNRTWNLTLDAGRTAIRLEASSPAAGSVWWLNATRLVRTKLEIDYCHFHPSTPNRKVDRYDVWIDLGARPSQPEYQAAKAGRPDAFNAHDQLRQWSNESRVAIQVSYHASLEGFALDKVDGVGNPVTVAAPPYWLLYRNGESAEVGMTLLRVRPNDEIAWRLC